MARVEGKDRAGEAGGIGEEGCREKKKEKCAESSRAGRLHWDRRPGIGCAERGSGGPPRKAGPGRQEMPRNEEKSTGLKTRPYPEVKAFASRNWLYLL